MIYPWQQTQWQKVQQQYAAAKLPHALLLLGSAGLGKLDFAKDLAHSLLCKNTDPDGHACGECAACKLLAAHTHPDLFVVQAEEKGKAIKVDNVRQLSTSLQLTSQMNGYKIAIIVDADSMNINAANSLLKTLEEPTRDALLILVSSNPQKLPVTVRSRCQSINFSIPDTATALAWLNRQGTDDAGDSLNLAHGAPLLALALQQSELTEQHQLLIRCLLSVSKNQPILDLAAQLHKLSGLYLLNWLYDWIEDLIKLHQVGESAQLIHQSYRNELVQLTSRTQLKSLYDYQDQVIKNKQLQSIPLNTQLLWEDLLLSWHKQLKRV